MCVVRRKSQIKRLLKFREHDLSMNLLLTIMRSFVRFGIKKLHETVNDNVPGLLSVTLSEDMCCQQQSQLRHGTTYVCAV